VSQATFTAKQNDLPIGDTADHRAEIVGIVLGICLPVIFLAILIPVGVWVCKNKKVSANETDKLATDDKLNTLDMSEPGLIKNDNY
jgi:hypothetical protein